MNYLRIKIKLSNEEINDGIKAVEKAYIVASGKRVVDTLKIRLSTEEILLSCQKNFGENSECCLAVDKTFGRKIIVEVRVKGKQISPIDFANKEDITILILTKLEIIPKYCYSNRTGTNIITFVAEQKSVKIKPIYKILGAVLFAVLTYFAVSLLPVSTQDMISSAIVAPVFNKLTSIMATVATPLVFFAIVNGIAEIGDVNSLGSIGKVFILQMMITYLIAGVSYTVLAIVAYGVSFQTVASGGGFFKEMVQLVLDIVPNNMLQAFVVDNDLQVVVVAVFVGVAILQLQKRGNTIRDVMAVIGDLVNQMMTILFGTIPLIVFFGVLNILFSKMKGFESVWLMFVVFIASAFIIVLSLVIRVLLKFKVPFKVLFGKQLATTMINLTTSSQVAALPENMKCCKEGFGIQEKLVDFGLPLGIVVFMPNGAAFLGLVVWALSALAGIDVSLFQAIVIMLISIIVAIAAPPIPGSAFVVLPIMMSVSNLPNELFPVAIILGTIIGYFCPMLNGYSLQLQMLLTAKKLDMIDLETLRTPMTHKA